MIKFNAAQQDAYALFNNEFERLAEKAKLTINKGRNLSLALTHLEDASMRINRAIAEDGLLGADETATEGEDNG